MYGVIFNFYTMFMWLKPTIMLTIPQSSPFVELVYSTPKQVVPMALLEPHCWSPRAIDDFGDGLWPWMALGLPPRYFLIFPLLHQIDNTIKQQCLIKLFDYEINWLFTPFCCLHSFGIFTCIQCYSSHYFCVFLSIYPTISHWFSNYHDHPIVVVKAYC